MFQKLKNLWNKMLYHLGAKKIKPVTIAEIVTINDADFKNSWQFTLAEDGQKWYAISNIEPLFCIEAETKEIAYRRGLDAYEFYNKFTKEK